MHKATFLEGTLHFSITPDGPILIKAGDTGGADPTLPDMEFVRTRRRGSAEVYLPGSSLKGVIRAHCERICRSLDVEGWKVAIRGVTTRRWPIIRWGAVIVTAASTIWITTRDSFSKKRPTLPRSTGVRR